MNGKEAIGRLLKRLLIMGALVILSLPVRAQTKTDFDLDVVSVRSDNSNRSRLDVYTRIPFSGLRFINSANGFQARYDVTVAVYRVDNRNRRQTLLVNRTWEHAAQAITYAQTQARQQYDRSSHSVEVDPGRYLVEVRLEDKATRKPFVREAPAVVRDFSRPVTVSDLIVLESYDAKNNTITPNVSATIGTGEPRIRIFYELYADRAERVRVTREVIRLSSRGGTPLQILFNPARKKEDLGELAFTNVEPLAVRTGRTPVVSEILIPEVKAGDYLVRIRAEDEQGTLLDMSQKIVSAQWTGLDQHIRDLEQAIQQLAYIAKSKEVKYIRSGQTETERFARFKAFWDKRDPTPGTERNERMEEYYYRIASANKRFGNSNFGAGWKTDRGHVTVSYGEPDFIERHPNNRDARPYEVWYYYRIGRRFVFVDEDGYGDYRLMLPIWDERNLIR